MEIEIKVIGSKQERIKRIAFFKAYSDVMKACLSKREFVSFVNETPELSIGKE